MFKLNNKGTTLIELIISIVLISVVIIFMFRLIIDLNNEQENNDFAVENQINRAEVIRFISDDLTNKTLVSITDSSVKNKLDFTLNYNDSTKTKVVAEQNYIEVTNSSNKTQRWNVIDATIDPDYVSLYKAVNSTPVKYSLIIDIEIHTINENNMKGHNNVIDDLNLAYIGNATNMPDLNCLGYCCKNSC